MQLLDPVSIRALELARDLEPSPKNLQRVASQTNEHAARWAFLQWDLRKRAEAKKIPLASELLYTREALEQATHFEIARYHASLFPPAALVADLTVGIGCDLLALASRGRTRGYELDGERYGCAVHNAAVSGVKPEILNQDCLTEGWDFDFAIADPARRISGKRTSNPDEFKPDPAVLADRMASLKLGILKLSPLLQDSFLKGLGPGLQFVSFGGECREALVMCGTEAPHGVWAVKVEEGQLLPESDAPLQSEHPAGFLYEADPAVIRAHALGSLPGSVSMRRLGDSNGYLTSECECASPWVKSYRVLDFGRLDVRAIKAHLRELGRGCSTVKARAKGVDADSLLKQVRSPGKHEAILVLYPVQKSVRYALVETLN